MDGAVQGEAAIDATASGESLQMDGTIPADGSPAASDDADTE